VNADVRAALDQLTRALQGSQGRRPAFVQVLYSDGGVDTYSIPPNGGGRPPDTPAPRPGNPATPPQANLPPDLTGTEAAIVAVLRDAGEPLRAATIAQKCGRACNSHFRECLGGLIAAGVVRRPDGGGYCLAGG